MKTPKKSIFLLMLLGILIPPAQAAPNVLVSIKPIHSLAAAVMAGVGTPTLLIGGATSVHSYALKPSDARKIAQADVFFYVGADLETYLTAPIASLAHGRAYALETAPGIRRLRARQGGIWGMDPDHDHEHGGTDPHLWLDPENAIAMTNAIAATLSSADPPHARTYRANAEKTVAALRQQEREIAAQLAPLHAKPYLVFHDAYQYFEARFGLHPAGAIAVAPDRPVSPRRLSQLRQTVLHNQAVCLFREPQFPPKLVDTIRQGTGIREGVLDPLGANIPPGPELYPALLRTLAQSLARCLQ